MGVSASGFFDETGEFWYAYYLGDWMYPQEITVQVRHATYEIQLATNSGLTKGKKTLKVTSYSKASKKVTGLNAKAKYYIRIRTYTTISGTTYYSPWSKSKNIKTA